MNQNRYQRAAREPLGDSHDDARDATREGASEQPSGMASGTVRGDQGTIGESGDGHEPPFDLTEAPRVGNASRALAGARAPAP